MGTRLLDDAAALLAVHAPADTTEAGHRARMLALLQAGRAGRLAPCSRSCFDPGHFTASSFVLSPDLGAVLLILHARLGFWMQPGGHVEPDDLSLEAAARREVLEETGLGGLERWPPGCPGLLDVDIHRIPARRDEPSHEHFDLRWLFRSPSATLGESDEVRGVRWVPLAEVASVRSDASVMRAITRIRALLVP
ncbi:MAG: NUDIX hydrolase [Pseudomonadota bacterium]